MKYTEYVWFGKKIYRKRESTPYILHSGCQLNEIQIMKAMNSLNCGNTHQFTIVMFSVITNRMS